MIHGYKFTPGHEYACPHEHILALKPSRTTWKAKSWPRGLGFGTGDPREGVAVAFGWQARGTIWQAYKRAETAGLCLSDLITMIRQIAPHRTVHMLAHSLGARVVLRSLPHLKPGAVGRAILLNGAEFGTFARVAADSPAGRAAEIINITTRENDLFDFLLERLIRAPEVGDRSVAQTLPLRSNTLTIQLDHPTTLAALAKVGVDIDPGRAQVCHWSAYLRPGLLEFYRTLLRSPGSPDLSKLRAMLPDVPDPRWSKVLAWPSIRLPGVSGWATAPQTSLSPIGINSNTLNH